MLGCCIGGLFAFVALAVDLGILAVSRTQCQNAADVAALVGTRTLNNKDGVLYSNLPAAVAAARTEVTSNPHMAGLFANAQISKIEAGQYLYDTNSQTFQVSTWVDVTNGGAMNPASGSWTAMRITLTVAQPTYFMRVWGVTSMPSGARATAVYRPRDIAFVLDMTGSMQYACLYNTASTNASFSDRSHNPDTAVPNFGHYTSLQSRLVSTANQTIGSNEAASRNNYTISTPGGPPIIRNFYFDPSNVNTPATVAFPLTTAANGSPNLLNAFHRWSPPESGGDSTNYVGVTYNFTGYNAFHKGTEPSPKGPTPAPDSFKTMTDTGGITYVGDRWRRGNGAIDKTNTSWATNDVNARAALTAADLLGYTGANPPTVGVSPAFATDWSNFRDAVWEKWGYDLDIVKYRTQRSTNGPMNPDTFKANNGNNDNNILLPQADRFIGYSMGPSYWGKTFYIWPPDPRAPTGDPGVVNSVPGDWRRRFFLSTNVQINRTRTATNINGPFTVTSNTTVTTTQPFDPQVDNNNRNGNAAGAFDGINKMLLGLPTVDANGNPVQPTQTLAAGSSSQTVPRVTVDTINGVVQAPVTSTVNNQTVENFRVNYPAVLKWIKSGPQTLPPNLRAGRVLYYSSIPDDVDTTTATGQAQLDKAFWKNYIDFVMGIGSYTSTANLYGGADSWGTSPLSVPGNDLGRYKFSGEPTGGDKRPHMRYLDSPMRPRQHFWFGPLSMVNFVTRVDGNWLPGTCYEAQCWQLKAGMNSVLDDVKNNHPNDWAGMVMFAADHHNGVRVTMGQNYKRLKNGLFYPRSLLNLIDGGNMTSEVRPYTGTNLTGVDAAEIPNAGGSTDPNTGLAHAFNMLSSSNIPAAPLGTGGGRRGAQKIIILETDGVPNTYRDTTFQARGFNSYYEVGDSSGNIGNGDTTVMNEAYDVVRQIVKPMATTSTSGTTVGADSGLSLLNAPARVYPIGFGDLFDEVLAPSATFRSTAKQFLGKCAELGGTGPANSDIANQYIITGPYTQRISRLRDAMERIFQSGVSVVLVE